MILNKIEKESPVIELLYKGHNVQQVSKQAHVSFTDIAKIRRKITGETEAAEATENENKEKSLTSKGLGLLLDGKSPVEVTIALDLKTEEVIKLFNDFLSLQNMHRVAVVLKDYRKDLGLFLKWFYWINRYKINSKDLSLTIRYVSNRNFQLKQKEDLEKEIASLIEERDYLLENIRDIKDT
jgi:hypothetical protein